jgi:hypothetical protein
MNNKVFECELCEYKTDRNYTLTRHIKNVHQKIKDAKCELCDYVCSQNSDLKKHAKQVHTKLKDVKCDQCDYVCSTNGTLKMHNKQVHDKIKDIECKLCDYKCSRNSILKIHIKSVHTKLKDFKCNLCDAKFSKNSTLKMHIKMVHTKLKDVNCILCDFKCSQNSSLKLHIKRVHERSQESKRMSLGEFKIHTILKKFKVEFKQEFKFQDLISEKDRLLRFDVGIKNKHNYLLIEFDGATHFQKVRWSNIESEQQINDKYEYIQQCDKQKNDYVSSNNHHLLRIRYDDFDVEDKILDFIIKNYDTNIWQNNQRTI